MRLDLFVVGGYNASFLDLMKKLINYFYPKIPIHSECVDILNS